MAYLCELCSRTFATTYALKRHISDKHQHRVEEETSRPRLEEDPSIWDDDVEFEPSSSRRHPREEDPSIWDVRPTPMEDLQFSDDGDDDNLTFPLFIDPEDYRGTTLDDAIKDKAYLPTTEWPNGIYREFMEIVTEYQLSNSCGYTSGNFLIRKFA